MGLVKPVAKVLDSRGRSESSPSLPEDIYSGLRTLIFK